MKELFVLLRYLDENYIDTQRTISDNLGISLGKVNKLIKVGISEGYIDNDISYQLTEKARDQLKEHRVEEAIILGAGLGYRFVPMTQNKPKGLVRVNGERIIERLIRQLHERDIKKITLVVGYQKEKYEYLSQLYGINLVYNSDYATTNNVTSVNLVRDRISNAYILSSDLYMEENYFEKYEYNSWMSVVDRVRDGQWGVSVGANNRIEYIDELSKNSDIILGPAYLNCVDGKTLASKIKLDCKKTSKRGYYWENSLSEILKDVEVYARRIPSDKIYEFKTVEQLRSYDRSYDRDPRNSIIMLISDVFKCDPKEIYDFKVMEQGMTNNSFLFTIGDEKFVFRVPGKGTEELINRQQEADVYEVIKDLDISDKLYYIDPKSGYKITRYYENCEVLKPEDAHNVMRIVKSIHEGGLSVNHDFDIQERIEYYTRLCKNVEAAEYEDSDEVRELVENIMNMLNSLERPKTLCHIDPVIDNFIRTAEGEVRLLDWEYAGMADPLLDIAMHAIYSNSSEETVDTLIDLYTQNETDDETRMIVYAYVALSGYLWALWTLYKEALGENYGTYGMEQYQFARVYGKKVEAWINETK